MYTFDLAISAVSYDALFVGEMTTLLSSRLPNSPAWDDSLSASRSLVGESLDDDVSRIVVVLWQRLWGTDEVTTIEAAVLRDRVRRCPRSVVVITLDETELPEWMASLRHQSLSTVGIDVVAEFLLAAIAEAGGSVSASPVSATPDTSDTPEPPLAAGWPAPPPAFLRQTRAHSALRRELDSLGATLRDGFEAARESHVANSCELYKLPHRLVARFGDIGVTFSWIQGRDGSVAGGRLMVIEWIGIAPGAGVTAFRTAQPSHECIYHAEAQGPEAWHWRHDRPNGTASSTFNLVGEWLAAAAVTARKSSGARG